jgi:hypothetical protein
LYPLVREVFDVASEDPETLDRLVAVVNDRIVEGVPELRDPTLRPELEASTRSHWKGFLTVMNRETIDVQPAPPIHDFARTLARRGFELPVCRRTASASVRLGTSSLIFCGLKWRIRISDPLSC